MGLTLVTGPTSLPVDASDMSAELHAFSNTAESADALTQKLHDAVGFLEGQTCRAFMSATWMQTLNEWPGADCDGYYTVKLGITPLASITHVKYYDADGTLTTVSSSDYWTITTSTPPKIAFKSTSFDFPTLEDGRPEAIQITFVAGHASKAAVPHKIKAAVKALATHWYNQRDVVVSPNVAAPTGPAASATELPYGLKALIADLNASGYS